MLMSSVKNLLLILPGLLCQASSLEGNFYHKLILYIYTLRSKLFQANYHEQVITFLEGLGEYGKPTAISTHQ